jgi:hypothetical protein
MYLIRDEIKETSTLPKKRGKKKKKGGARTQRIEG